MDDLLSKYIFLIAPLLGWLVAQSIKTIFVLRKDGIRWMDLFQSGGMPSAHAAFFVAQLYVIGWRLGLESPVFALSLAVTSVVLYDTIGVRRTTGEQTRAIKKLFQVTKTKQVHIHDAKGHNFIELVGGVLVGAFVGAILSVVS